MKKQAKPESKQKSVKNKLDGIVLRLSHTSLPEIALLCAVIFGKYLKNADFSYPNELIVPILFFAILATVVVFIYHLVLRGWLATRVASLLLCYTLYSYSYLPGWVKGLGKLPLPKSFETTYSKSVAITIILALLCGAVGWGVAMLVKKVKFLGQLQLHKIILFFILFTFTYQSGAVLMRWQDIQKELAYKYDMPAYERDENKQLQTPDIYYFVFDRYTNVNRLKDNFGYDNTGLMDFLKGQGFVTREDGYSNYPFTMMSISSTMRMGYHTDLGKQFGNGNYQGAFAYRYILNNPPIAQVLRKHGYTYNQISSWWDFTRYNANAEGNQTKSFRLRIFGKNFYLSDLNRDILNKSIMSPWIKKGITVGSLPIVKYDQDRNPAQNFHSQIAAVKEIAARTDKSVPQFTFAHILAPHDPYVFDANGKEPNYDSGRNDWGIDERTKYTEELTYINKQMRTTMAHIREKSPNAVIIIQADEGPYPKAFRYDKLTPDHYYDPSTLSLFDEKQKYGIIASYYLPGVDEQTVRQNITASVNPFRFILKEYMGYKLDMLPDCQFATGNKFTIYTFKNETAKLSGKDAEVCETLK